MGRGSEEWRRARQWRRGRRRERIRASADDQYARITSVQQAPLPTTRPLHSLVLPPQTVSSCWARHFQELIWRQRARHLVSSFSLLLATEFTSSHLASLPGYAIIVVSVLTEARILGLTEKCYKRTHLSQPDQRVTASTWNTRVLSIRSLWYVLYISVTDLFMSVALQAAFRMWAVELRSAIALILET